MMSPMKNLPMCQFFTNSRTYVPLLLLLLGLQQGLAQELGDHQYTTEAIEAGSRVYTQQCALCAEANSPRCAPMRTCAI